jgi:transcription antitermination protein NusB
MNRRKSREVAMQFLYEMKINKETVDGVISNFQDNNEGSEFLNDIDMNYVRSTIMGVETNISEIDSTIEKYLVNWKLERLSKVDLAILRICTYEIIFEEDTPDAVIINEGIELAKKYSGEKSAAFINGVLANIMKK